MTSKQPQPPPARDTSVNLKTSPPPPKSKSLICPRCGKYPFQLAPHDCAAVPSAADGAPTLKRQLQSGWVIEHDQGTGHVAVRHENGGGYSLVEVKTYGTPLGLAEADHLAGVIAVLLRGSMKI